MTAIERRPWIRRAVVCAVALVTGCLIWAVRTFPAPTWYWPAGLLTALALMGALQATRWQQASLRDALTGLFNRRHLTARLEWQVRRSLRRQEPLSLIIIDVDDFKLFNDQHGHAIGDEVLVAIAHLLRDTVRQSDWIARWGGEEFAIVLPSTPLDRTVAVAERIRSRSHSLRLRERGNVRVTISAGIATCPEHATTAKDLLHRADEAMYRAKQKKDRVLVAQPAEPPLPPQHQPKTTKRVARSG